ncbi:hypothetical protein HDV00_011562 [Rhizophlyctis rosea]|nr:hypothetical protein HDV00_011562 [Rhizophlyctis rosea]
MELNPERARRKESYYGKYRLIRYINFEGNHEAEEDDEEDKFLEIGKDGKGTFDVYYFCSGKVQSFDRFDEAEKGWHATWRLSGDCEWYEYEDHDSEDEELEDRHVVLSLLGDRGQKLVMWFDFDFFDDQVGPRCALYERV